MKRKTACYISKFSYWVCKNTFNVFVFCTNTCAYFGLHL